MAIRGGSRFPVSMSDVFPHGCHLLPDSVTEAMDYDEKTKTRRPAVDKVTGKIETTKNIYGHLFAQDRTAILAAMNQAVSRLHAYESADKGKNPAA